MSNVRLGILGYGNLGKGVELAVRQNADIDLAAVYSRRDPESVQREFIELRDKLGLDYTFPFE